MLLFFFQNKNKKKLGEILNLFMILAEKVIIVFPSFKI